MISHSVEYCPDDIVTLRERLDELAQENVRILSVLWQPQTAEATDQAAAVSSRGSFVIIVENNVQQPLRERSESLSDQDVLADAGILS